MHHRVYNRITMKYCILLFLLCYSTTHALIQPTLLASHTKAKQSTPNLAITEKVTALVLYHYLHANKDDATIMNANTIEALLPQKKPALLHLAPDVKAKIYPLSHDACGMEVSIKLADNGQEISKLHPIQKIFLELVHYKLKGTGWFDESASAKNDDQTHVNIKYHYDYDNEENDFKEIKIVSHTTREQLEHIISNKPIGNT